MFGALGTGFVDGFGVGIGSGILISTVAMTLDVIRNLFSNKKEGVNKTVGMKELIYGI